MGQGICLGLVKAVRHLDHSAAGEGAYGQVRPEVCGVVPGRSLRTIDASERRGSAKEPRHNGSAQTQACAMPCTVIETSTVPT